MIFIYRIFTNIFLLFLPFVIIQRIIINKEHPYRFFEKLGFIKAKRPTGKLIWFHVSSVGELLSIIPLIEKIEKTNKIKNILLTSSTLSSSKVFGKLKLKKTIHQFCPIDLNLISKKFIDHWNPAAAIFVESEIWPNIITNLNKRKIPLVLLNARLTKKSFKKWKKIISFANSIFKKFDVCLAQNDETKIFLNKLGADNIKKLGNLKFSETNIKSSNRLKTNIKKFLSSKNIIFGGISTHHKEEIFCAKIHLRLKEKIPNALTIIIPRHIDRSQNIKKDIEKLNLKLHLHSSNEKIDKKTDIYLVDTFGETKLFLNLFKIVFLGGSIMGHGGQNPLEAARLGCKVIHGKNIANFKEVYSLLNKKKISRKISTINQAESEILKVINSKFSSSRNISKLN